MSEDNISAILEAALFASSEPLTVEQLQYLFDGRKKPAKDLIKSTLKSLQAEYTNRGVELIRVASGYRFQARSDYAEYLRKMWEKKPPRYSRALLETLSLIAYRQPMTRGEIEDVRGVTVSTNIIKTLLEREWIKIVGSRDVPGKPALFGTTKQFLDYFNLKSLSELPTLDEPTDQAAIEKQLGEQLALISNTTINITDEATSTENAETIAESVQIDETLETETTAPTKTSEIGDDSEVIS